MKYFKNKSRKQICLSLVALILVMLMTVGITYSWIDDVKQIQINTVDDAENTPLKTGVDINAKVNVTKKENTINLGNLISENPSLIKYNTGETDSKGNEKTKLKYDGSNASRKYDPTEVNKYKGYFYESGDMHLSGCYSDGEYFYFPKSDGGYREGNKDDENVNYISFTTQVTSEYADVDFWFKNLPKVYKSGTNSAISQARYAVSVNGQSHVYASSNNTGTVHTVSSGTVTDISSSVRKTSTYTYNNDDNTTDSLGKNSNVLFSVKKGDTVNVTIKIWLENDFDTTITASDINMELVSSWAYTRKVTIVDRTTNGSGTSWIDDDSAKLYLTVPKFMEDRTSSVSGWSSVSDTENYSVPFWEINNSTYKHSATDSENISYNYYEIDVPLVFNNEELVLYRSEAWNTGNHNGQQNDHGVTYWNWWRTFLPNTYKNATYTIYGSSMDEVANNRFGDSAPKTFKGYGTWGGVDHIKVYSHYNNTDFATNGGNLFVRDHSDEDTSGEVYTYAMYRADNNSGTPWQVYLPKSSALIQFHYYLNDSTLGTWGYKSWNEANPQQRPLASSGLYESNSTVYHFTNNDNDSTNKDRGRGYWEGANCCYVIKAGFLAYSEGIYHYMWQDDSTNNGNFPGPQVTATKNTSNENVYYQSNKQVFTSGQVYPSNTSTTHKNIIFTYRQSNGDKGDQTPNLTLFPGCFYLPDSDHSGNGTWLGSLTDTGRSAAGSSEASGGDDSGSDASGGSIDGYTVSTNFVFKISGTNYRVYTNSSGTTFKVRLNLSSGDNWTTVQLQEGNYPEYGNGESGKYYEPKDGVNLYLTTSNSNNFSIRTNTSGDFIATFEYDNGNTNTIKITSILKES